MPIYEYLCHDCSFKFELKQSMKDDAVATCERCGKSVSRLISSPAIMFKGSGWYVTDYSDKMKPPAGESSSAPASPPKDGAAANTTPAPATPAPAAATTAPAPSSAPSTTTSTTSSSGNSSGTT